MADILSRIANEKGEDTSKQIHKAKKAILADIRNRTTQLDITSGQLLTDTQLKKLLTHNFKPTSPESNNSVRHQLATCPPYQEAICQTDQTDTESDNDEMENQNNPHLLDMIEATTFQAGQMTVQDFTQLQDRDDYCTRVKEDMAKSNKPRSFIVRSGILLKIAR